MSKPQSVTSAPCTPALDLYRFDSSSACATKGAGEGNDSGAPPQRGKEPGTRPAKDRFEPRGDHHQARVKLQQLSERRAAGDTVPGQRNVGASSLEVKTTDGLQVEYSARRQTAPRGAQTDLINLGVTFTRQALEGKAKVAAAESGHGGIAGFDVAALSAEAAVKPDKDGLRVGAQASVVGGAVRVGGSNPHDARDEQVRVGLSYGAGLEGRLHWSDKDADGRREYGFGVNVGPLSFDLKSEAPLFTAAKVLIPGPPNSHELVREAVERLRSR